MSTLSNKIDFIVVISVNHANPNGDPLNGNRPREDNDGYGIISDVCIKRKIRNRFQDMGKKIFVQSEERCDDNCKSLRDRAKSEGLIDGELTSEEVIHRACKTWIDVRCFGQIFAFSSSKSKKKKDTSDDSDSKGISIPIRGPVSIRIAQSVCPISNMDMQITKSVPGESNSDRMGSKHFVDYAVYLIKGSISCQLAEKTGFSEEDADTLHKALETLFENDASSARPEGSMEVCRVYWWKHKSKMPEVTTAQVHRSIVLGTQGENKDYPKSINDYYLDFHNPENCVDPIITPKNCVDSFFAERIPISRKE